MLTKGKTVGISKGVITKFKGIIKGIIEGITEGIKDKIIKILLVQYKGGGVRIVDIERLIDIPAKSLERYIKQLKEAGINVRLYVKWIGTRAEYIEICNKNDQYSVNIY